jgi:TRAP-type mannitol/chloroaromatic compound transport system permease small subunit
MKIARFIIRVIDTINENVGYAVGWVTFLLVVVVTFDVIMRYVFNMSFVFIQELEWHLFGIIFLVGAGYTLLHNAHVRVDIFYQRLNPRWQAIVNLLGTILFLFPGCYLVIDTSWNFVENSFAVREGSPDPGGIPARYILKSAIPIGFSLIALQGVSLLIKSVLTLTGRSLDEEV